MKMELGSIFFKLLYPAIPRRRNENGAWLDFLKLLYPAILRSRTENTARFDFFKIIVSGDSQNS